MRFLGLSIRNRMMIRLKVFCWMVGRILVIVGVEFWNLWLMVLMSVGSSMISVVLKKEFEMLFRLLMMIIVR